MREFADLCVLRRLAFGDGEFALVPKDQERDSPGKQSSDDGRAAGNEINDHIRHAALAINSDADRFQAASPVRSRFFEQGTVPRLRRDFRLSKGRSVGLSPTFPKAMAYAIIKTGGRQYRVAEGDTIDVDLLEGEAGQKMTFDDVLMHADGEKLTHGSPSVSTARSVTGEVVEQRKDKKVIAFKYRRRKGYHRTVGHRRKLTRVKITGISLGSKSKKAAAEKEAAE